MEHIHPDVCSVKVLYKYVLESGIMIQSKYANAFFWARIRILTYLFRRESSPNHPRYPVSNTDGKPIHPPTAASRSESVPLRLAVWVVEGDLIITPLNLSI